MKTEADIKPLVELIGREVKARLIVEGMTWEIHAPDYETHCHMGKKFARVDIGTGGRYMVDLETGTIYGIKAYGVVHRGHVYGTLDTINDWDWSGYAAHKKAQVAA